MKVTAWFRTARSSEWKRPYEILTQTFSSINIYVIEIHLKVSKLTGTNEVSQAAGDE